MKINYKGIEIEGEVHEVANVVKQLAGEETGQVKTTTVVVKDGGYGAVRRKKYRAGVGRKDWQAIYEVGKENYERGLSIRKALKLANDGKDIAGQYRQDFVKYLESCGIEVVRYRHKKRRGKVQRSITTHNKVGATVASAFEASEGQYAKGLSVTRALYVVLKRNPSGPEINAFRTYLKDRGINVESHRKSKKQHASYKPKKIDGRSARMSFISKRRDELMIQGLNRKEASKKASNEWNMDKKIAGPPQKVTKTPAMLKTKQEETAPRILDDDSMNTVLIDMIKNIIKMNGKLTYFMEGEILNAGDKSTWADLCAKVMENSKAICDYLGVENKLQIAKLGNLPGVILYK